MEQILVIVSVIFFLIFLYNGFLYFKQRKKILNLNFETIGIESFDEDGVHFDKQQIINGYLSQLISQQKLSYYLVFSSVIIGIIVSVIFVLFLIKQYNNFNNILTGLTAIGQFTLSVNSFKLLNKIISKIDDFNKKK